MKLIGTTTDGRMMLTCVPQELVDLEEAARTITLTVGTLRVSASEQAAAKVNAPLPHAVRVQLMRTAHAPAKAKKEKPARVGFGVADCEICKSEFTNRHPSQKC